MQLVGHLYTSTYLLLTPISATLSRSYFFRLCIIFNKIFFFPWNMSSHFFFSVIPVFSSYIFCSSFFLPFSFIFFVLSPLGFCPVSSMFPDLTPNTWPLRIPDKKRESVSSTNAAEWLDVKLSYYPECRMYWSSWHDCRTDWCVTVTLTKGKELLRALKALTFRANKAWFCD